jgi:hypothetical protein
MIFGNNVAKTKLVEQLTLVTPQTAHHGSTPSRIASTQRNHASQPVSTDFCNKIGTFRTSRPCLVMSVIGCRADLGLLQHCCKAGNKNTDGYSSNISEEYFPYVYSVKYEPL